jgi:hypothetical protein
MRASIAATTARTERSEFNVSLDTIVKIVTGLALKQRALLAAAKL